MHYYYGVILKHFYLLVNLLLGNRKSIVELSQNKFLNMSVSLIIPIIIYW